MGSVRTASRSEPPGSAKASRRPGISPPARARVALCIVVASALAFALLARPYVIRLAWAAARQGEPAARQIGPADCGPAALAMILDHHGVPATLPEITRATGAGAEGTSLLALRRVAAELGLPSQGRRVGWEGLLELPLPAIAHVHGDHFVVLRRIDGREVVVDDPAVGRLRMRAGLFRSAWRGVVLAFESADPREGPH